MVPSGASAETGNSKHTLNFLCSLLVVICALCAGTAILTLGRKALVSGREYNILPLDYWTRRVDSDKAKVSYDIVWPPFNFIQLLLGEHLHSEVKVVFDLGIGTVPAQI